MQSMKTWSFFSICWMKMESCASGTCRKHPPTQKPTDLFAELILNCRQQLPHAVWTDDRVSKALIKLKKSQVIACSNFRGLWSNVWNIYWIWRVQREKTGSTAPTCQSSKLTSSSLWGKFCVQVGIILFYGFNVHTCNVYMYTDSWINTLSYSMV